MKYFRKLQAVLLGAILISTIALSYSVQGQQLLWNLSSMNSTAAVNLGNPVYPLGMYSWIINGQNQLSQQWFWYRVGATAYNTPLNSLGLISATQPAANQLNTLFGNNQITIGVNYVLNGSDPSGTPDIQEGIQIRNISSAQLTLHFFQYSDFDLGGTPSADSLAMVPFGSKFVGAEQIQSDITLSEQIVSDTSVSPFATAGEAGTVPDLINKITGIAGYNLDSSHLTSIGDSAWALQWDLTLNPGQIVNISKNKTIQGVPVPEPASLAFLGLGLMGLWLRKRSR